MCETCWLAPICITNPSRAVSYIQFSWVEPQKKGADSWKRKRSFSCFTSNRFPPSLVKVVHASILARPSWRSLVLALASDQGHTTVLWLIKVQTPHVSSFNGVLIPTHIAFCKHCSLMLIPVCFFFLFLSSTSLTVQWVRWRALLREDEPVSPRH